jgi:hypothetical protein
MEILIYGLILLAGYLIGLFTNFYYPKYMQQKGKNLATKEDIGDITKIVESIKTDLAIDVETLKSELSLLNQNKISLKSEERKALLDFHLKYSLWHNSVAHLSTPTSIDEIDSIFKTWQHLEGEYKTAESMLHLFVNDKDFIALKYKLYSSTLDNLKLGSDYLFFLKKVFSDYEINKSSFPPEIAVKKYSEHINEIKMVSDKFRDDFKNLYPDCSQFSVYMTKEIQKRLASHDN